MLSWMLGDPTMTKTMEVLDGSHYIVELVNVGCTGRVLHNVDVMLVKMFWYTWYALLDFSDVYAEYLRKLFLLLYVHIYDLYK